jgi:uncharacterized Zn-finger protein
MNKELNEKEFECSHKGCNKGFTTRFSLRRHMVSHKGERKFQCKMCGKFFLLAQYLKEHEYIHTGANPYKCKYAGCDKAFKQAGKLSQHKKMH